MYNSNDNPSKYKKKLGELLEIVKNRGLSKVLVPARETVHFSEKTFFIADISDVSIKDDIASMEHPLFALKAGDMRTRVYEHNGIHVAVKPGHGGCATIHDKDIWIYCISQMVEAINRGCSGVSRTVRFTAYDFLTSTNRDVSGRAYGRMTETLGRLRGTSIETNVETARTRERQGFGLIDAWKVIERNSDHRMAAVEVTLPNWLYRSVMARNVLTLSKEYFKLRKPIDRRIYELARKHCGAQKSWKCEIKTLYEKSGSTDATRNFKVAIKALANSDQMPEYKISLAAGLVTFTRR